MKYKFPLAALLAVCFFGCLQGTAQTPADKKATKETVALYRNLHKLQGKAVLFGHQDALAYGVGWKAEAGRSDIKDVTGEYPAVFGWELGHLELDSARSLDQVPFASIKQYIRQAYDRGGVNTISWHFTNPVNGKSAWDVTPGSVKAILPGGEKHTVYVQYLEKLAAFLGDLKGPRGEAIPILWRPFHELTGNWFWWCQNVCTPQEFISLWRFTADYLRNQKKLHNLLLVYNAAGYENKAQFMERYPGDDYADMVSFDIYQHGGHFANGGNGYLKEIRARMTIVNEVAKERGKLAAIAETGYEAIPMADWWTSVLLPQLKETMPLYVLVWRNAGKMPETGKMHYYAPFKGQTSADDFVKFAADESIYLEQRTKRLNLYKK